MALDFSKLGIFFITVLAFSIWVLIMNWKKIKLKRLFVYSFVIALSMMLIIIGLFTLPWIALYAGLHLLPAPPRPEIIYDEFPFRLEYEINGQRVVLKDTLICEYDGIGINTGSGKYFKWKEHLASGNERVTLLKISNTQEIYYRVGHARYYMGVQGEGIGYIHSFPDASLLDTSENVGYYESTVTAEELFNKYNIELISWDYTEPISQKRREKK